MAITTSGHDLRKRLPDDFTTGRSKETWKFANLSFFNRLEPAVLSGQVKAWAEKQNSSLSDLSLSQCNWFQGESKMRKYFVFLCLLFLLSSILEARDYSRIELLTGYSFIHTDASDNTPKSFNFDYNSPVFYLESHNANLNGWNGSITLNINRWLGIMSELRGHHGSMTFDEQQFVMKSLQLERPVIRTAKSSFSSYSFLFGPKFTFRINKRITPFTYILFGQNRESINNTNFSVMTPKSLAREYDVQKNVSYALGVGGGVDLKLNRYLAFRAPQIDYLLSLDGLNARISLGLAIHLDGK
jgi:hypothetical protein